MSGHRDDGWRGRRYGAAVDGRWAAWHGSKPGRADRARAEARAAHWRFLDPQGRWHADSLDLRSGRGQGPRHRRFEADRSGPREGESLVRPWPGSLLQPDRQCGYGGAGFRTDRRWTRCAELKAPAVATALAAAAAPAPVRLPHSGRCRRPSPAIPRAGQAADHHRRSRPRLEGDDPGAERDPLTGREDRGRCHDHPGQGFDRRQPLEVRRPSAQLQGHAGGAPETKWSDANKTAFLKAVHDGKGLVVFHWASAAFTSPNWAEFEKAICGGWRSQGYHGPKHKYTVKKTAVKHPISDGLPAQFDHTIDELYQNSMMVPGNVVLATAYSDPSKPRGTGKDEPVIWVNTYGKGRVYVNALGHDVEAMSDPNFRLDASGCDLGGDGSCQSRFDTNGAERLSPVFRRAVRRSPLCGGVCSRGRCISTR